MVLRKLLQVLLKPFQTIAIIVTIVQKALKGHDRPPSLPAPASDSQLRDASSSAAPAAMNGLVHNHSGAGSRVLSGAQNHHDQPDGQPAAWQDLATCTGTLPIDKYAEERKAWCDSIRDKVRAPRGGRDWGQGHGEGAGS